MLARYVFNGLGPVSGPTVFKTQNPQKFVRQLNENCIL
jgi:hypothetical protein